MKTPRQVKSARLRRERFKLWKERMNNIDDYIDKEGKIHYNIRLFKKDQPGYFKGWYFIDERYSSHGPFDSLEECEETFKKERLRLWKEFYRNRKG